MPASAAPHAIAEGAAPSYVFQIARGLRETGGQAYSGPDTVRWHYKPHSQRARWLRSRTGLVFHDASGADPLFILRSEKSRRSFDIRRDGEVVGRIRSESFLRTKYSLELDGGETWWFRVPLFRTRFTGHSSGGKQAVVDVGPTTEEWTLYLSDADTDERVVLALAFIHYRWRSS